MINAKNRIKELLEGLGLQQERAVYSRSQAGAGAWTSVLVISLPDRCPTSGTGTASTRSQADIMAAENALAELADAPEGQPWDWVPIRAEAQAGDALLKLAAYLAAGLATTEDRSLWLQIHESDFALANVFDRWRAEGAPEFAVYGAGLGEKLKSTLVEAVIWRRYGSRVLGVEAAAALGELREVLSRR